MISDVLAETVNEIDRYLTEMPDVYQGALRVRVERMRDQMESLRIYLDSPPLTEMERVAKVAARIRGESVPDWQRRGFLHAEKPSNDEHSFGL